MKMLRMFPVPLGPADEQRALLTQLELQIEQIDRQVQAVALALKQSTAQRQNILRAAFAGQLVPQDPNDEPASVLLERIRAERAQRAATTKPRKRQPKE
jgi:type I restriction enzyme S subunit